LESLLNNGLASNRPTTHNVHYATLRPYIYILSIKVMLFAVFYNYSAICRALGIITI